MLASLKGPAVFRFNEVISERPGVTLDQLIVLSPRPKTRDVSWLDVSWHRTAIAVKPKEGWRTGVVYRLTLLAGITDLRNNRTKTGRTLVFSTGGPIPSTRVSGRVIDWEAANAAQRALIEVIHVPDSLVYWDLADSTGTFSFGAIPPGRYVLAATVDKNNNRRRDYREPFDSTVIELDSTFTQTFWAFTHDTISRRVRTVTSIDSLAVRIDFNQSLRPGALDSGAISLLTLPDSSPVGVSQILTQPTYDSLQTAKRAAADTGAAARQRPVGGAPPAPAVPAPSPALGPPRPPPPGAGLVPGLPGGAPTGVAGGPGARPPAPDSALIRLLKERPRLASSLVVVVSQNIRPGGRYLIRARATNPSGATAQSSQVLAVPKPPAPRDSTRNVLRDSTRIAPRDSPNGSGPVAIWMLCTRSRERHSLGSRCPV